MVQDYDYRVYFYNDSLIFYKFKELGNQNYLYLSNMNGEKAIKLFEFPVNIEAVYNNDIYVSSIENGVNYRVNLNNLAKGEIMKKILICALIGVIAITSVSCGRSVADADLQDSNAIDSNEESVEKIIENNNEKISATENNDIIIEEEISTLENSDFDNTTSDIQENISTLQEEYAQILMKYIEGDHDLFFQLYDFDLDDFPELIIVGMSEGEEYDAVYTYKDYEVKKLGMTKMYLAHLSF